MTSDRKMIFLPVFGTPSALSSWVVNLATVIVNVLAGDFAYIAAVTIDDFRNAWSQRDGKPVIFHTDCPQRPLVDLFLATNIPTLVVTEQPNDVYGYVRATREYEIVSSMRFVTQSLCTLCEIINEKKNLVISDKYYKKTPRQIIDDIINHFDIIVSADEFNSILVRCNGGLPEEATILECVMQQVAMARPPGEFAKTWSLEEAEIVARTLPQYACLIEGRLPSRLIWPAEVFPHLDKPGAYAGGHISLQGPARVFIGGHALHLPRGQWRARILIEISNNWSGNFLFSDILAEEKVVSIITAKLPAQGAFEYDMTFNCDDPFFPLHVRLAIQQGAIEGELSLRLVCFDSISEGTPV